MENRLLYLILVLLILLSGCQRADTAQTSTETTNPTTTNAEVTSVEATTVETIKESATEAATTTEALEPEQSTLYYLHQLEDYSYVIMDQEGTTPYEGLQYASYIPDEPFVMATYEDALVLIDLKDLTLHRASNEKELSQLIAQRVYGSDIYPVMDEDSYRYAYYKDGQALTEHLYLTASHFIDGFAVVEEGDYYDGTSTIFDAELQSLYSSGTRIIPFGNGIFGEVYDYVIYDDWYNKFHLIDVNGQRLYDQLLFEAHVLHDDLILVGDHLNRWFINGNGATVIQGEWSIAYMPIDMQISYTGDLLYVFGDRYELRDTIIYDAMGNHLFSNIDPTPSGLTALIDDYYIEHHHVVNERFINIHVPQLSVSGDYAHFKAFNSRMMDYYYGSYEPETVDLVSWESETDFNSAVYGRVGEITMHTYWYGFGAAHPNSGRETYHLDLDTGESLTLADLSDSDAIYDVLTELVQKQVQEDPGAFFDPDTVAVDQMTMYQHTEDGIIIYYVPYEISAYAYGYPEFYIPYSAFEDVIDKESVYYKQLNR